jgi:hypothetical protein
MRCACACPQSRTSRSSSWKHWQPRRGGAMLPLPRRSDGVQALALLNNAGHVHRTACFTGRVSQPFLCVLCVRCVRTQPEIISVFVEGVEFAA